MPLHVDAQYDRKNDAKEMVTSGASLSAKEKQSKTVIQLAINFDSTSVLRYVKKISHQLTDTQLSHEDRRKLTAWTFKDCFKSQGN